MKWVLFIMSYVFLLIGVFWDYLPKSPNPATKDTALILFAICHVGALILFKLDDIEKKL